MRQLGGQILRLGGLLIEMVGVVAVLADYPNLAAARLRLPGGPVVAPAWIAIALGFLLWLIGTILIYGSRRSRS
jgi:hypothetical protein